jgi:carotenoid cleavage dioxygenase-like enzyme
VKFTPYSIHQISVTGDYAIVVLGPVEIDFLGTGVSKCLSCETHDKLSKDPTMIYVFSLLSTDPEEKPITIPIPPPDNFFVFHHINAILHDDGHNMDLDMCVYFTMNNIATNHVLGNLKDMYSPATRDGLIANCDAIRRVSFDIKAKIVTKSQDFSITDAHSNSYRIELASPNPNLFGKPYCYIYAPTNHMLGSSRYEDMGILKVDLCVAQQINAQLIVQGTPTVVSSWSERGVYLGEPLFVPNPQSTTEDDGVVLVLGRNGTSKSVLLILDAKDLTLRSKILAPFPLMFETHGRFIA